MHRHNPIIYKKLFGVLCAKFHVWSLIACFVLNNTPALSESPLVEVNALMSFELCNQLRAVARNSNTQTLCLSWFLSPHIYTRLFDPPPLHPSNATTSPPSKTTFLYAACSTASSQMSGHKRNGSWVLFQCAVEQVQCRFQQMGYHECIDGLYTNRNQLAFLDNLVHGEKWTKSKGNFNLIYS